MPFLWVADAGSGVAQGHTGSTAFVGHASIELEALDSVSSEQVAADIETRMGKKYNWTEGVSQGKFVLPAISSVIPTQAGVEVPQHYDIPAIAIPGPWIPASLPE